MEVVTSLVSVSWDVLNNTTFAALIVFLITATLAKEEYRRQKDIDRESDAKGKLVDDILRFQEYVQLVLFLIDRSASTYEVILSEKSGNRPSEEMLLYSKVVREQEIPRLAFYINEEIPLLQKRIESRVKMFFGQDSIAMEKYEIFGQELKNWHQPLAERKFDLTKKVESQKNLTASKLFNAVEALIKAVWTESSNKFAVK